MEYLVACNWDFELMGKIAYPEVAAVFAGLPDSLISGGRPSQSIQRISDRDIRRYIQLVHEKKWSFDFNINSTCTANKELTPDGFKDIMKYLEWLCDIGVDCVTVANTNLIGIVKKNFPKLRVNASTFLKLTDVAQARRFEDLGVDLIMLSENINRDFKALRAIRKAVKCKLALIANVGCIYDCPNAQAHANSVAHSGARGERSLLAEPHMLYCFSKRLERPEEVMKIRWIRPEDVSHYEDVGINMLKIIERSNTTEVLAERVRAYCTRSYDGNLLKLLGQMMDMKSNRSRAKEVIVRDLLSKPLPSSFRRAVRGREFMRIFDNSLSDLVFLDNKSVPETFIEGFKSRDCRNSDCTTCGNCKAAASKSVQVLNNALLSDTLYKVKQGIEDLRQGSLLF